MNRHGFVIVPEKGHIVNVTGLTVENGIQCNPETTPKGLPPAAWFTRADNRDAEMDAYARQYPGITLAKVEITEGVSYPPAQRPSRFSFSEKGKTPL
jgi:hypothetical protein